jgi:hypothetical protein
MQSHTTAQVNETALIDALRNADAFQYTTTTVEDARQLMRAASDANKRCTAALLHAEDALMKTPSVDECQAIIENARKICLATPQLERLEHLSAKIREITSRTEAAANARSSPSLSALDTILRDAEADGVENDATELLTAHRDAVRKTAQALREAVDERMLDDIVAHAAAADELRMNNVVAFPVVSEAAETSRRIRELDKLCADATSKVNEALLKKAVDQCDLFSYGASHVDDARLMRDAVVKAHKSVTAITAAKKLPPSGDMQAAIDACNVLRLETRDLNKLIEVKADTERITAALRAAERDRDVRTLERGLADAARMQTLLASTNAYPIIATAQKTVAICKNINKTLNQAAGQVRRRKKLRDGGSERREREGVRGELLPLNYVRIHSHHTRIITYYR